MKSVNVVNSLVLAPNLRVSVNFRPKFSQLSSEGLATCPEVVPRELNRATPHNLFTPSELNEWLQRRGFWGSPFKHLPGLSHAQIHLKGLPTTRD